MDLANFLILPCLMFPYRLSIYFVLLINLDVTLDYLCNSLFDLKFVMFFLKFVYLVDTLGVIFGVFQNTELILHYFE